MRAIIDESVPGAKKYYSTYLFEPSPAGDMTLTAQSIAYVGHMDLERLLTEMKDIGSGGEILVVTHASPEGFLMKLRPGADATLKFAVMDKILHSAEGVRRREAIRSLSSQQAPQEWIKWFVDFDPGVKPDADFGTNPDWQKFVQKKFDAWFETQGKQVLKLPHGGHDLNTLLGLLSDVRALSFKRIEFRACQIGADLDAMKKIAAFLGVATVVGPKNVETFYGIMPRSHIKFVADDAKFGAALRHLGGRSFPGISFGVMIQPHGFLAVAQDLAAVKAFVQKFIKLKYAGSVDPLVIGGFNSVGRTTTTYVFPLESDYKKLIDRFDTAAP